MEFPATLTAEEGGYVVRFRDIPEAITQGDDEADALEMAEDALISSMDFYFEDFRVVPAPSAPLPGERLIALPAALSSAVLRHNQTVARKARSSA